MNHPIWSLMIFSFPAIQNCRIYYEEPPKSMQKLSMYLEKCITEPHFLKDDASRNVIVNTHRTVGWLQFVVSRSYYVLYSPNWEVSSVKFILHLGPANRPYIFVELSILMIMSLRKGLHRLVHWKFFCHKEDFFVR